MCGKELNIVLIMKKLTYPFRHQWMCGSQEDVWIYLCKYSWKLLLWLWGGFCSHARWEVMSWWVRNIDLAQKFVYWYTELNHFGDLIVVWRIGKSFIPHWRWKDIVLCCLAVHLFVCLFICASIHPFVHSPWSISSYPLHKCNETLQMLIHMTNCR